MGQFDVKVAQYRAALGMLGLPVAENGMKKPSIHGWTLPRFPIPDSRLR